jgi:hypothetical protein
MAISTNYFPETKIHRSIQDNSWLKQGKVLTERARPLISLYKPASATLSYGIGLLGVTQSTNALVCGASEKRMGNAFSVAKGVADLTVAYFQNRVMIIVNSVFELTQGVYNLAQVPREEKPTQLVKCLSISVQLLAVVQQNSLQWTIISLVFQALTHFYQAYQISQSQDKPENIRHEKALTIIAKTAMGFIRLYQAQNIYQHMQLIKAAEKWLAEEENNDLVTGKSVKEQANSTNPPQKPKDKTATAPEWVKSHPLKNLAEQIDAKRVVLIDPTTQKKYDFGAYFHGYGQCLVNGANLRFQRKVSKDGTPKTELSFKVNLFYLSRNKEQYENLKINANQIRTLQESSNAMENGKIPTTLKDAVSFKSSSHGWDESPSDNFSSTNHKGETTISLNKEELTLNLKSLVSMGGKFNVRGIRINGIGSIELVPDHENLSHLG